MWWIIPLGLTILATMAVIVFYVTAEGEDIMAAPIVLGFWVLVTFGSWGVYGFVCLALWLTS